MSSYNRGYRSNSDNNNRYGSGSYHDRNSNRNNQRQQWREYNLTSREVSNKSQDHLGANTNAVASSTESTSESKLGPVQNEGLSAEEKRKLRQAKLAKWKQKQGTPEAGLVVTPVPQKKTFSAKLQKPVVQKKGSLKIGLLKKTTSTPLFSEGITNELEVDTRQFKKPKFSSITDKEEVDEDPLEKYMAEIDNLQGDQNETLGSSSELMDEEIIEQVDAEGDEDSITDLLNQSHNMHKAKDIPEFEPSNDPIIKKFYNPSFNSLKQEDVSQFMTLNQISVKPDDNSIRPINEFGQLGLTSKMLEKLQELNFIDPTPIQKIALPVLMSGHDVIAVAKTGSGKTLSFVLPMIRHIVANLKGGRKSAQTPIGLILTPTRELALQIHKDCKPFLKALNLRGACCYGGSNISSQIAELKKGAELVVCTPGRLIDLLTANGGRVTNLSEISSLVLDEADRMFDLGFEPQIMKIIKNIRPDRQTCLFSATFAKKIENLATKILVNPVQIIVGGGKSIVSDTITQRVMIVKPEEKFFKLLKILGDFITEDSQEKKLLVFCSTQDRCDNLLAQILQRGYKGLSIHGGKDQLDRDGAIREFQKGGISILVATSIAARGLDVKDLGIVINYDAPNHMEDYVHRVGRTGRAGRTGIAYTFVEPGEERAANDIAKALRLSKNIVPDDINSLAENFQKKIKEGAEKFSSGFGGKGLEKLDEARLKAKNLERKSHGEEVEEKKPTPEISRETEEKDLQSIDFNVIDGPVPGKLDSRLFHSKIYINDLPQKARVLLSQEYATVIEQTNVSITTKGTFIQDNNSKDEKLHILIESDDRMDVVSAVSMLKSVVIEGIRNSNEEELRKMRQGGGGKYTV